MGRRRELRTDRPLDLRRVLPMGSPFKRDRTSPACARYLLPDDGVFNLGYRYRRDVLEQVDLSFLYPINDSWSAVGRYYYSLFDNKALETVAGAGTAVVSPFGQWRGATCTIAPAT